MYRVFAYNKRRTALFALSWKALSRHDDVRVPAYWKSQAAARKYAATNPDRVPHGFIVLRVADLE